MVESLGDGLIRTQIYAKWRTDKPADEGYSAELVGVNLDPSNYENVESMPPHRKGCYTFLDYFEVHAKERPNDSYLGSRVKIDDKTFGAYEWMSYK